MLPTDEELEGLIIILRLIAQDSKPAVRFTPDRAAQALQAVEELRRIRDTMKRQKT